MKAFTKERKAYFIELGLVNLICNTIYLEEHAQYQLSNRFTVKSDLEKFKKLLKKFRESNEDSFGRIKKSGIDNINNNWYNLQNYRNFEDQAVNNIISFENFLTHLCYTKIRAIYHLLELNILRFNIASKKVEISIRLKDVRKQLEIQIYINCDEFMKVLLHYSTSYKVDLDTVLGENMVRKWTLFLEEYSSRNKTKIAEEKATMPYPDPLKQYDLLT